MLSGRRSILGGWLCDWPPTVLINSGVFNVAGNFR